MRRWAAAIPTLFTAFCGLGVLVAEPISTRVPRSSVGAPPPWEVEDRIFAHDQEEFWGFGNDVTLDGDTALVGAWRADVGGEANRGAAYVFVRQGTEWIEQAQLLASDGQEGDRFGWSVALDGNTAVVGATLATVDGRAFQGAVYVFEGSGSQWSEAQKLVTADGAAGDQLGRSVAIEGGTILAGADRAKIGGNQSQGAVYVFQQQAGVWIEFDKLFDPEGQQADLFGNDVTLHGDTALVGAQSASIDEDPNRGATYVYQRVGTAWILEQKLLASDGQEPDQFGNAVALTDDTALIGAWMKTIDGNANQGAAYVFRRTGATWSEEQRLTASDGDEDSRFGWAVALDGGLGLVAGRLDFPPGNLQQGVVYEFRRQPTVWEEVQEFLAPAGEGLDGFGEAMALDGARALIASPANDVVLPLGGTAWIFRRPVLFADGFESGDASAWTQTVR